MSGRMLIRAYHGSQRWSAPPEIRPSRKGNYEGGPGIYATTSLARAVGYAKGGGSVVEFGIAPDIVLLEDVQLPLKDMIEAARRLRGGSKVVKDLEWSAERRSTTDNVVTTLPAQYLVNLAVNNDALGGQSAVWLAEWLAGRGIHASVQPQSGDEDWLVVFDPKKLVEHRKLSAADMNWDRSHLPRIAQQRAALAPPAGEDLPAIGPLRRPG